MKTIYYKIFSTVIFSMGMVTAFAETSKASGHSLANMMNLVSVVGAVILIFSVLVVLYSTMQAVIEAKRIDLLKAQGVDVLKEFDLAEQPDFFQKIYKKLTNVVPIEKEQDIMLDHDYDGIKELDNSLPPWWVYMFYLSIIFGFFYIPYYHWSDTPRGQLDYYEIEMEEGEKIKRAYLRAQADLVNENNAEPLTEELALTAGESSFKMYCAACHGQSGEGGIGPNLTDSYWLHGGGFKSIFKSIKYGFPEKGMVAWNAQMGASEIHKIASYIKTIEGTSPPNPKEPQGELYTPQAEGEEEANRDGSIGMNQ